MFVRDRRRHRTVKADLLQVGRSQSALFLREQWERLRERGIEWERGGRWRWMLLIKMSRQWRQCRITQTLIRVFVRGHKMRAAHPSSPLSSLFPPSFQPFSPLSFPLLISFLLFLFIILVSFFNIPQSHGPLPHHHPYFNLSSLWPLPLSFITWNSASAQFLLFHSFSLVCQCTMSLFLLSLAPFNLHLSICQSIYLYRKKMVWK